MKERTLIFYHAHCPDGFGGAYAAWKKFGDTAEYLPIKPGSSKPEDLSGAHVYFIDFTYPKDIMDAIVAEAASVVVLDHHLGVKDVVESMPEFVFDEKRSGATIAWKYFHPNVTAPTLFTHIEDDDLFLFKLSDTRPIIRYLGIQPFSFEAWDTFIHELDDENTKSALFERLRTYSEYFDMLVSFTVERAKKVQFEGYECYFANSSPFITMRSAIGNALVKENPPIALVVSAHPEGFGVSLRSDGSADVAAIARKYGGNGHPASAGFSIAAGDTLPWTLIEE